MLGSGDLMTPTIRLARPEDAEALARLKRDTFRQTFLEDFGVPYPPADLAVFEEASYGVAAVAASLADVQRRTLVAEAGAGHLLGYAHFGPCKLPHPDVGPGDGELYQLYVLREAQGLKLGGRLLSLALEQLAALHPGPVWLGVWSENHRAQAIYARRGFAKAGEYQFPVGAWRDEEYIFCLRPPGGDSAGRAG